MNIKKKILFPFLSTIALYDSFDYPLTGWGEKLPQFFKNNVKVYNFGVDGASKFAELIAKEIKKLNLELKNYVVL